ncbi:UDP-N-acetyl-D-mannosamine dehydrogenase [Corynebacterium casei]|uniref:UDP-N-acetyl-D-mannosamine dehydrogenase n=1 Tax=Corynebacterium casei TaxID=160386 RepID=UPI003FD37B9D
MEKIIGSFKFEVEEQVEKVCVIGLGYIGLPTAAFLANGGQQVVGVDINRERVELINAGRAPFLEAGFDKLLSEVVSSGNLIASLEPTKSDVFILAVPTPFTEDHKVDATYIDAAVRAIAPILQPGNLVVLESTCSPGTTRHLAKLIYSLRPDLKEDCQIEFAHAPERVLPGNIMEEMVANDRIIGGLTPQAAERTKALYASFCHGEIRVTDAETAEMTKLAENAFRDVNIAFANELSLICDKNGVNVWELIGLANLHPRVNILSPGPGVGGHCIAVDPWFLVGAAPESTRLIQAARRVNDSKPDFLVDKIAEAIENSLNDVVALFGLSFKANIEDLRESPSLRVLDLFRQKFPFHKVLVVEPNIRELPSRYRNDSYIELVQLEDALMKADTLVFLVDHHEFLNIQLDDIGHKTIIDAKGIFSKE